VQTRRLATSFGPLTRSVALSVLEKFLRKATCSPVVLVREFVISARRQSVK